MRWTWTFFIESCFSTRLVWGEFHGYGFRHVFLLVCMMGNFQVKEPSNEYKDLFSYGFLLVLLSFTLALTGRPASLGPRAIRITWLVSGSHALSPQVSVSCCAQRTDECDLLSHPDSRTNDQRQRPDKSCGLPKQWLVVHTRYGRVCSVWGAFDGRQSTSTCAGDYDAAVRLSTAAQGPDQPPPA